MNKAFSRTLNMVNVAPLQEPCIFNYEPGEGKTEVLC